jgi:hypothetical protein
MGNYYDCLYAENDKSGFEIRFSVGYEDSHPKDCFDDSAYDIADMVDKIDRGVLSWFVARVDAYKNEILLASDYLGANLYENPMEFMKDGYYDDMKERVIEEARQTIAKLTEDLHEKA